MSTKWGKSEIYLKATVNIVIFCLGVLATVYLLPALLIFMMPFVVGAVIAWLASPVVRFCEKKLKIRRKTGTAVVIILVIAVIILLLYLLGAWLVGQIVGFIGEVPDIWASVESEVAAVGARLTVLVNRLPLYLQNAIREMQANMGSFNSDMVSSISAPTFEAIGRFAGSLPLIVVNVVMCLLSSYFFIAERDYIIGFMKKMPEGASSKLNLIRASLRQSVGGYFKAQLKIEVWIYLLLVIGFLVLRVEFAFFIAVLVAIFDFLPMFGTGLILIPWALVKLINADYFSAIGLILIQVVAQLVRQIIQPKIMGDTIGVAPIPTLVMLYLGFRFAGIFGMIVALPLGIIVINLYQGGVFDTTKRSVAILIEGINKFRKIEGEP
jgi:sporulation integral membrane protein YtvI